MDFFERLPAWLPLASHPPLSQMLVVGLIIVTGLMIVVLVRTRRPPSVPAPGAGVHKIGERVAVQARPLMNDSEVSTFNLLLLAVRDHFLLLPKMPLRSIVQLRVDDDASKRVLAQTLRNVTVDFVAIHPGTQLPVKAIFFRKPGDDATASSLQEQVVDVLFHKAGIEVLRLDQEATYDVEQLTRALGLEEEA